MRRFILNKCAVSEGSLILVNASHPYMSDTRDMLVPVVEANDSIIMERRAAVLLSQLMYEIHGWNQITAVSGWRSKQEQKDLWDSSFTENGKEFTQQFVALPGCSEHQTGLAIDLGLRQKNIDLIRPYFPYSGICQTFRKNAARYGFILRYPSGKEHITGIAHEPWHFRYVGVPHAEIMTAIGLTLEEYHELLKHYHIGQKPLIHRSGSIEFNISYLPVDEYNAEILEGECIVSGDNQNGFVITRWKSREN